MVHNGWFPRQRLRPVPGNLLPGTSKAPLADPLQPGAPRSEGWALAKPAHWLIFAVNILSITEVGWQILFPGKE